MMPSPFIPLSYLGFFVAFACIFVFALPRRIITGSATRGRFRTVSHSQWSSGRTTAPANPNICTVGWSMWRALFRSPCSINPFYSLFNLAFSAFPSFPFCFSFLSTLNSPLPSLSSLLLGYLVRYTGFFLTFSSRVLIFVSFSFQVSVFSYFAIGLSVRLPVLDTGGI